MACVRGTVRSVTSVHIVEDDASSGRLLQRIVESAGDGAYATTLYTNAEDAWKAAAGQPPVVMLVDVNLPGMSGIDLTREMKQSWPATKIIMVTGCTRISTLCRAFQAGADGFLNKPLKPVDVLWAIDQVLNTDNLPLRTRVRIGEPEPQFLNNPATSAIQLRLLSPRQTEIMSLVAAGLTDKQTAEVLGISLYTICDHWKSIRKKLGKPDRASCIATWLGFQK